METAEPKPKAPGQPKVQASGIAGALATLILWGVSLAGVEMTQVEAGSLVTVIMTLAGYFKRG